MKTFVNKKQIRENISNENVNKIMCSVNKKCEMKTFVNKK